MGMFDKLLKSLAASRKTIVFTEGTDARILDAAARILKEDLMGVILCGNVDEVKAAAAAGGYDIDGAEILDPLTYGDMEALVAQMVELRKGKMTEDEVRELLKKSNYFGTMLVKAGKADALLGGATYSTADTVRPALQIIKTKPGSNLVSSSFILFREKDGVEERIAMGDCAINLAYTDRLDKEGNVVLSGARQLAEVAVETAKTASFFGIDPKVAVLSFSTYGSGKGGTVQLSHDAVIEARNIDPDLVIDGKSRRPSAPTPKSPARPTPSSSRSSRPATSATRLPSVSAVTKLTAPSFRV